ncbi:MAG: DinB family protein [Thermoanaerobaculia bacterium]
MNPVAWTSFLIRRELRGFAREIELFPDEVQIWQTVPGVSNSAGTLALHVCGNLQHFVGAVLGGTAYVRDRPLEFSARGLPRAHLLAEIERTLEVVASVLPGLSEAVLAAPYPDVLGGLRPPTGLFLHHLSCHLSHHLGQAGYLRRMVTGDNRSSDTISMESLAEALPSPGSV